jgi:alkylation response protein AidB-like acyl-CoA dehydrogenase
MILELTDAQKAFQQRIERFANDRVRPEAAAIDAQGTFPRSLVGELAGLGLMGVTIPVEWGGAGRHCRRQQLARCRADCGIRHRHAETDVAASARVG